MTDSQFIFIVIVLLYLSECLIWVSLKSVAFRKAYKDWNVLFSSTLFGNESGGVTLAYPFPMLGKCFISHLLPVSMSAEGVINTSIEALTSKIPKIPLNAQFISFKDITSVNSDSNVLYINDSFFCKCGSDLQAKSLSKAIDYIAGHIDKEKAIIEYIESSFNTIKIKELIELIYAKSKLLSTICNIQFCLLMIIAPALVYIFGAVFIIWSGLFLVVINISIIVVFNIAHIDLYPNMLKERITDSLKMFFCPPLSIRAVDILTLHYLSEFHPLAVSSVVLESHQFQLLIKQAMLSYNFPYSLLDDMANRDILKSHLGVIENSVESLLSSSGIDAKKLIACPERSDNVNSFCPRCHSQFSLVKGECPECTSVTLIEYTENLNE